MLDYVTLERQLLYESLQLKTATLSLRQQAILAGTEAQDATVTVSVPEQRRVHKVGP